MRIDVHSHFYPPKYVEAIRRFDAEKGSKITGVNFSLWNSTEERIAWMDAAGIDVAVLSLSAPNVYFEDHALSLELAQMTNDFVSEIVRKHPDRFVGMASLPLGNINATLSELRRCVSELGLRGVVVGSNINGSYPDTLELEPLFAEIEQLRQPIFIHPMVPAGCGQRVDDYKLVAILYLPFDTTICVTRMIYAGVFERYPSLEMILPHLGGTLPFLSTRIDLGAKSYRECREHLSKPPCDYLKRFYYDTAVSYGRPPLACTEELVGTEQIIFGSDYPFQRNAAETIAGVEALRLAPEVQERIFSGNARKLFQAGIEQIMSEH